MTAYEALLALKKFLEDEVASGIMLQKENASPPEYVHPYVAVISLPHKNFMPMNFQVPFVLIGLANGNEDDEANALAIRITCATYGGDIRFEEQNNLPDEKGYLDLINLIERTKNALIDKAVIPKAGAVEKPFSYGIYNEEITYPYWYGYIEFTLQIPLAIRQMADDLLMIYCRKKEDEK